MASNVAKKFIPLLKDQSSWRLFAGYSSTALQNLVLRVSGHLLSFYLYLSMTDQTKYELRGVSPTKSEVHEAIKGLDKGLYPLAFCKILPDLVGNDQSYCNIMHADTAGTKTSLAYMYWRETGDLSVWEGISQDAIVMNIDDMACVGCLDQIVLSSTIGRNKNLIPGEVIKALIDGTSAFIAEMGKHGVHIYLAGGETADVGDIVRTIDVGFTTFARMARRDLVINDIQVGDVIVGLSSFGQTSYERSYNAGIGSNGLTAARHDVLAKHYATAFPDGFDQNTEDSVVFTGTHHLADPFPGGQLPDLGRALLSPTRTYLPILKTLLNHHRTDIHGIIHCTGGGQAKVLKFIRDRHIIKDNLFETPPLFQLIQRSSQTSWSEMYQVFNMGHRLEIYTDEAAAKSMIDICAGYQLEAKVIGHVEEGLGERVTVRSEHGNFVYR